MYLSVSPQWRETKVLSIYAPVLNAPDFSFHARLNSHSSASLRVTGTDIRGHNLMVLYEKLLTNSKELHCVEGSP